MKRYIDYLMESNKTYSFRIKIAGDLAEDAMDKLENMLERYSLESISKPQRTPIQAYPIGFSPEVSNLSVNLIDIETNYPTTPHELKVRVTETLGVSAAYVVVTSADFPESEEKEKEEDYEVLLTSPYPKDKDKDKPYGDKFNQEFLKDIKTRKHKIAGKPAPKAKTLNDEKQGNTSPIGSK